MDFSTAIGFYTTASGDYSTAMGDGTTASDYLSFIVGKHNLASNKVPRLQIQQYSLCYW